jgi:predicted component of type VI protein secretion system
MLLLRHTISGETWQLTDGRLVVGRKDAIAQLVLEPGDAPLALADELVSRRHAVIRLERGIFWVTDAGSTDGTYVNERRISEITPIGDGDTLRFGDSVLVSKIEQPTASVQSAPRLVPPDQTVQYRPAASVPQRQVEPDQTVFQSPPPGARAPAESPATPALFSPVPTASTTQQRSSPVLPPAQGADAVGPAAQASPTTPPVAQVAPLPVPANPSFVWDDVASASSRARVEDVAAALRKLEREAASVVDRFERAGGKQALQSFVALSARLQGGMISREDIDALLKELPTVQRLLEVEMLLVDLISTRASDASR